MQTKGAIGNLINRYRAVLKKCNLLNTFGTLAIASALAMGGVSLAKAADVQKGDVTLSGSNSWEVTLPGNYDYTVSGTTTGNISFAASGEINANINGKTQDVVESAAIAVDATNGNAVINLTDGNFKAGSITLTGKDESKTATLNIQNGVKVNLDGAAANNIDGGTSDAAKWQVVNVDGTLLSTNGGNAAGLTLGSSKGITMNVGTAGKVAAGSLTVDNGSSLDVSSGNIYLDGTGAKEAGKYNVHAKDLKVDNGSAVVAKDLTIADKTNSALILTDGSVKVTDTLRTEGTNSTITFTANSELTANTLDLGKALTVDNGTLSFGSFATGSNGVTINGGTVDFTGETLTLAANAGNGKINIDSNGGTLKAKTIDVTGDLGNKIAIEANTFHAKGTNDTVALAGDNSSQVTIKTQEGGNAEFLTGTLGLGKNGSLVLGTDLKDDKNQVISLPDTRYDQTYTAGNATVNLTDATAKITAEKGGDWTIGTVSATDKEVTDAIKVGDHTSLTIDKLNVTGEGAAASVTAAGNGSLTLGKVEVKSADNSNTGTLTIATKGTNIIEELDIKSDNATVTLNENATINKFTSNAGSDFIGADSKISVAAGKTLIYGGEDTLTLGAAQISAANGIVLGSGSTFDVDSLKLTGSALTVGNADAVLKVRDLQLDKGVGSVKDLTLKTGTVTMASGEEDASIAGDQMTVSDNGTLQLTGKGNAQLALVLNGTSAKMNVADSGNEVDWTINKLDVQNGAATVGSGQAVASLNVTDEFKTAAGNSSVTVKNLSTLTSDKDAMGIKLATGTATSDNIKSQITVEAGAKLRVDGLGTLSKDQATALKALVISGQGLLDLGAATVDGVVNSDGTVAYKDVAGLTSDDLKKAQAIVENNEAGSLSGGFASIKLNSDYKDTTVNGTLELTGVNGVLGVNKKDEVLNMDISGSVLTLGNTAGGNGSGELGKITGAGTLNAVNGKYTVASIGDETTKLAAVNADAAELTSKGDVFADNVSVNDGSLAANGKIDADTITLGGETAKVNAGGDIKVATLLGGTGSVTAKGDVTFADGASIGTDDNIAENITVEGKNINLGNMSQVGIVADDDSSADKVNLKAAEKLISTADITFNGADVTAGAFDASGNTSVLDGTYTALGYKGADGKAVANNFAGTFTADNAKVNLANDSTFSGAFTAQNGAEVVLGGKTKFDATPVTALNNPATADDLNGVTKVVINQIDDNTADGTVFTAQGQFADENGRPDASAFMQVKSFSKDQANNYEFAADENGFLSLGAMNYDEMMNHYNKFVDSKFGMHSAVAVGTPVDLTKNTVKAGKLDNYAGENFFVGEGGLFIADVSALDGALLQGKDGSQNVVIKDGAAVHLAGAKAGKEYLIADKVANNPDNIGSDFAKSTDNRLVIFDSLQYGKDKQANQIIASTSLADLKEVFPLMDPSLQALLGTYASTDAYNSFLDKALYINNGMSDAQIANAIESAAKAPMVIGAVQTALGISTMGADFAAARTSFMTRVAGASVGEDGVLSNAAAGDQLINGTNLWIMPMYQNTSASGFQSGSYEVEYDSDFTGVAVGADYTWANSFRLGATINMGTGSAESKGSLAYTENDYDSVGFGVYAGYMLGNVALSADLGYTKIDNEITQKNPVQYLSADGDTEVWTLGLRAERKFLAGGMEIIPHAGLRYSNVKMDEMNFSNVLSAEPGKANIVQIPLGVTLAKEIATESGWSITPSLDLSVIPVLGDTDLDQDVHFTGLGAVATMETEILDEFSGRAQLGVEATKGNFYMGLDYSYQGSSNMDVHGVQANIGFKF